MNEYHPYYLHSLQRIREGNRETRNNSQGRKAGAEKRDGGGEDKSWGAGQGREDEQGKKSEGKKWD